METPTSSTPREQISAEGAGAAQIKRHSINIQERAPFESPGDSKGISCCEADANPLPAPWLPPQRDPDTAVTYIALPSRAPAPGQRVLQGEHAALASPSTSSPRSIISGSGSPQSSNCRHYEAATAMTGSEGSAIIKGMYR